MYAFHYPVYVNCHLCKNKSSNMDGTLHVLPFIFLTKKRLKACTVSVVYVNFSKNSFLVRYHYRCESECKDKGFILFSQTF